MKGAKGDATKIFESSFVSVTRHFDETQSVEDFIFIHGSTDRVHSDPTWQRRTRAERPHLNHLKEAEN